MLKLKTSLKVGIPKLVHFNQFSCGAQNEHKNTAKQNEIVTDEFRKQLTYIIERNKNPTKYQSLEKRHISTRSGNSPVENNSADSQLTNITGTLPIISDVSEIPVDPHANSSNEEIGQTVSQPSTIISNLTKMIPEMTPVLLEKVANDELSATQNQLPTHVDLSSALVPLSIHSREKNFLVDSVVQDARELFYKTSEKIAYGCFVIQDQSRTYCKEVNTFLKQPETPQNFVREQVLNKLSVFKEAAILLCEKKESSAEKKPEKPVAAAESPVDKIKKTIQNLLAYAKQKLEEAKKKAEEAKKSKEESEKVKR